MTIEQLQEAAASHGFNLTPIEEPYDGEPRSDYSDGSDDEQSNSARWRAEQRLKRQYLDDTQDLY